MNWAKNDIMQPMKLAPTAATKHWTARLQIVLLFCRYKENAHRPLAVNDGDAHCQLFAESVARWSTE